MVIGESAILGQVRGAFSAAIAAGADDAVLSRLFHSAIRTGRKARAETGIGRHSLSISAIAVQQSRALFSDLGHARVLVIGAGEAGRLAAEALVDQGVSQVRVANRSPERGAAVAGDLGGTATGLGALPFELASADVVIACTGSPQAVVDLATLRASLVERPTDTPLLIVDIGVPRDFDPASRELPGVTYCDLDDLQSIAGENAELRGAEMEKVSLIIETQTARFLEWWEQLQVIPTISALTDRVEELRRLEMAKTLKRLRLDEVQREHVETLFDSLTRALTRQILHDPISALRERGDRDAFLDATRTLFRLDDPARWQGPA
jgi:glutamyl-tRNA reductase